MFRIASEKCYETNLFKSIQTIPVLVEFYPSVVVRHICRTPLLIFLRFIQRITIAEKKIQDTEKNYMYFMVKPHTTVIWMIYDYIRATYGWHTTTYERHTDGTRVHTSDIRLAHDYRRVTYGWHTTTYKKHTDGMRMTCEWHKKF